MSANIIPITLALCVTVGFGPTMLHANEVHETPHDTVLLWPDDPALNTPEGMGEVKVTDKTRIYKIKTPHLRVYPAPKSERPSAAIILVPGGGYKRLVTSTHDATLKWLSDQGIRPFMLMYRCPAPQAVTDKGLLSDIQRAVRLVRSQAEKWNIDPQRIGVLGSSAGGNLCVRASCDFDTSAYAPKDEIDRVSARPDFATLLYPAYLGKSTLKERYKIPKNVPPTMIIAARDDSFFGNSPVYEKAMQKSGGSVRSLFLDEGGHGFTLNDQWSDAFAQWLKQIGALTQSR